MNKTEFVIIIIFTFIVIMAWVIADIIHTRPSVPLNPNLQSVLDPINPDFDQGAINKIKSYQPNQVIPENNPPVTPQATTSASLKNPEASKSANPR